MAKEEKPKKTPEEVAIVRASVKANGHGLVLQNLNDMHRFAQYVVASRFAPKSFTTPEQIIVAIQSGAELNMPPMRSLQSFCVVNGSARLWGDAPLALVRQSKNLEYIKEFIEGEIGSNLSKTSNDVKAVCITKRKGDPEEIRTEFSVGDARRAGLWGKTGTWQSYPQRMLKYRARAFNLRDSFPDALGGATIAEEYEGVEVADINTEPRSAELLKEPERTEPMPIDEVAKTADEKFGFHKYKCMDAFEANCGKIWERDQLDDKDGELTCPDCGSKVEQLPEGNNG